MTPIHIPQMAEIEKLCFSDPWSEVGITAELSKNNAYFIVAEENSVVLGYLGLNFILDEGYIANIATHPSYRKQGIATGLLNDVLTFGKNNKLSFLSLEVRESNTSAISLYEKFDFKNVGTRKNFYSNPTENAVIMTVNL